MTLQTTPRPGPACPICGKPRDAAEAHRALQGRKTTGKALVRQFLARDRLPGKNDSIACQQ